MPRRGDFAPKVVQKQVLVEVEFGRVNLCQRSVEGLDDIRAFGKTLNQDVEPEEADFALVVKLEADELLAMGRDGINRDSEQVTRKRRIKSYRK